MIPVQNRSLTQPLLAPTKKEPTKSSVPLPFLWIPPQPFRTTPASSNSTDLSQIHNIWNNIHPLLQTINRLPTFLPQKKASDPNTAPLNTIVANITPIVESSQKIKIFEVKTLSEKHALEACAETFEEIDPKLINISLTKKRYERLQTIKNLGLQYITLLNSIASCAPEQFSSLLSYPNPDEKTSKRDFDKKLSQWRQLMHNTHECLGTEPSTTDVAQNTLAELENLEQLRTGLAALINIALDNLESSAVTTISLEENRYIGKIRQIVIGMLSFEFQKVLQSTINSTKLQIAATTQIKHLRFSEEKIAEKTQQESVFSPSKVNFSDFKLN